MRALTDTVDKAKQTLLTRANVAGYTPTQPAESLPELYQTLQAIEANLHHYGAMLAQYHQLVFDRRQLIDGSSQSINQCLSKLSLPLLKHHGLTCPQTSQRLQTAVRYLKRQGCPPCPGDIMHPVFQHKFKQFKWLHVGLFSRYNELIAALQQVLSHSSPLFPLDELIDTYNRIQHLTRKMEELEDLIQLRYQQQQCLHHEIKLRLLAINARAHYLKKHPSI